MRAVVQRVVKSDVSVAGRTTGSIEQGLMVLLGVEESDTSKDTSYMAEKITCLRIFDDKEGKMNHSLLDVRGKMLVVSQFTLLGDCRKGKRPSYIKAANPESANILYRDFINQCKEKGIVVEEGVFQAEMLVRIENDGPVTLLLDSKKIF